MRFIQKGNEPPSFSLWKQRSIDDCPSTWGNFRKPEKLEVLDSLLHEQGFICCYCGQEIDRKHSHIEHFQPRTHYPSLSLDYSNLLACCPGYGRDDRDKAPQEFCGHYKKDKELPISPLDKDCSTYFRYSASGEIFSSLESSKQLPAKETIAILGLNHPTLQSAREEAIDGILQDIDSFSNEDLVKLMTSYDRPDGTGKLQEFCSAIVYTLNQYIGSA